MDLHPFYPMYLYCLNRFLRHFKTQILQVLISPVGWETASAPVHTITRTCGPGRDAQHVTTLVFGGRLESVGGHEEAYAMISLKCTKSFSFEQLDLKMA